MKEFFTQFFAFPMVVIAGIPEYPKNDQSKEV